jgi:hypothetical protein
MWMPKCFGELAKLPQLATIALAGTTSVLLSCTQGRAETIECVTTQKQIKDLTTNVTDCRPITTVDKFFTNQYFSYAAPFAQGVSIPYVLADMLGISLNSQGDGMIRAFGFPDQQITWDGTAVQNAYKQVMAEQVRVVPLRTEPINNGFCSGIPLGQCFN